jgi:hypothetical protein
MIACSSPKIAAPGGLGAPPLEHLHVALPHRSMARPRQGFSARQHAAWPFSARGSEALPWREAIRLFVGNAERKLRGLSAQGLSLSSAKTRRARKKSGLERPLRLQQRQEIQGKETPHSCGQIRVSGFTEAIDCGTNHCLAQPLTSPCAGLVIS